MKEKIINSKIIFIIAGLLIFLTFIIFLMFGYSKLYTVKNGSASATVGDLICEIELVEANSTSAVSPYCIVDVKNYKIKDGQEKISSTAFSFDVSITQKEDFEVPGYYWVDMSKEDGEEDKIKPLNQNLSDSIDLKVENRRITESNKKV